MTYILHIYTKTDKINQGLGKYIKNKLWFWGLESDYKRFFLTPFNGIFWSKIIHGCQNIILQKLQKKCV